MLNIDLKCANAIRALAVAMVEKADSGHPGGPMGGADFIHILYSEYLQFDPDDMAWPQRDRFFLDPGHMSAMMYAQLHLLGKYTREDLENFRQWGSPTPGHPELDVARGIENTSGPLGQGHAFGVGAAIAERFLTERFGAVVSHKTYIYISDGGIQEEVSQGVGRIAGFLGLGQVIMFYDANDIQLSTEVKEVTNEDTAQKYAAWGWHVQTIEGHNHEQIRQALDAAIAETNRPSLIIGKTIMGKGALTADGSSYEGQVETHGKPLGKSKASFKETMLHLGADPEHPFEVKPDVLHHYHLLVEKKIHAAHEVKKTFIAWEKDHPELAGRYQAFLHRELAEVDFTQINFKANLATRNASGLVLSHLADHLENMIVASADLANSDKTEEFLKKRKAFTKGDFSGGFLQVGVSELTMAGLCIGMALHGGVIPACGTFFAFSDFMKPALRLAALMRTPVIFIWTHDAFRVGEDGPTHQPVEQEAQLRLLEKLKNHHGQNSFLVLRPADTVETILSWQLALENQQSPTGLILSRQDIPDLPGRTLNQKDGVERGGYLVLNSGTRPEVVLVGNGSEVSTLLEGAEMLKSDGIRVNVASIPSEGLFRNQDKAYQDQILPSGVPRFGLTAGLPVTLQGLVGTHGQVHGLDHFGYSAPYKVLDQKFGFTAQNVYRQVMLLLGK